ncbi:tol-pal system protein YbgF [Desulfovibrio sp.]|uniref:tol-pal system protein YbgF n=1 Tax=Desulfovibrio sp. TaxID=885 RepID=UPI003D0F63D8
MNKLFAVPLACVLLSTGCASTAQLRHVEGKETANQKTLRETDQRLNALEQSVATLDSQVAQLKNRTFEVRTRGGQKTSMTVVPILPPAPVKPVPSAAAGASSDSPGATGAALASEPAGQRPPDVALGHNGPSVVTAPPVAAPAAQAAPPVTVPPVAASAGSSGAAPLAAEPAPSSAKTSEKTPAAKGKETPPAAVAPETASGPKGRVIDPAAPPRSFPQDSPSASVTANGAAATTPAAASPAAANPSQGKAATAGPHGQVGTSNKTSQPASGAGTPSVGLPPVAAPEPVVPPAVSPTNFASQGTNQPTVPASPASSGKGAPAGGNAAVPVPSLPPSELALPPEYPGLPPVEAAGAATPTATSAPAVRAAAPAAQTAPTAPAKPSPSAAAAPQAATQQAVTQQAARPAKNEKAAYDAALKFMTSGRSAEGITRFEGFLQEYPQGVYAANAEYWIGEGLYAQGNYQEALNQFRKVDASYPQHHKNADALLKTGMCLSRLGDKTAAAEAYKQLLARFPNSEAARIARSRGLAR